MSCPFKRIAIVAALWQVICAIVAVFVAQLTEPLLHSANEFVFGDWEAAYGRYLRVAHSAWIVIVTAPATWISLSAIDRFGRRPPDWSRRGIAFLSWNSALLVALMAAYEFGLAYAILQLAWALFGPPSSIYNFTNLVLPNLLAWLACTVPVGCVALCHYGRSPSSR